jgi:hypothetical protein
MSSVSRSKGGNNVGKTVAIGLLGTSIGYGVIAPVHAEGDGPEITGGVTMIGQQFSSDTSDTDGEFGATLSVDLNFEKEVGEGKVTVYIMHAEGFAAGNDPGVNSDAEGADTVDPNDDAGFAVTRIAEAKLEYPLSDALVGTVGKISPQGYFDGNNVANDQTTQFLGAPFVNNTTIAFPGETASYAYPAGLLGVFEMSETITIQAGYFEEADGSSGAFKNNFLIAEADIALELLDGETNIRGIYWSSQLAETTGIAVSADQTYGEDFIFFVRYGQITLPSEAADTDLKTEVSGGVQAPFGEDYTVGVGYAISTPNKTGGDIAAQTWLEAYISTEIEEGIAVALNYQQVTNIGFSKDAGSFTAIGGRIQVDF